jgi:hypothetical protein
MLGIARCTEPGGSYRTVQGFFSIVIQHYAAKIALLGAVNATSWRRY